MKVQSKRRLILALALILAGVPCVYLGCGLWSAYVHRGQSAEQFFGPAPEDLPSIGQPVVDAVLAYQAAHGKLPANLAEAGMPAPPTTVYGPFEYNLFYSQRGKGFEVLNGRQKRDGFVVFWSSEFGVWRIER